MTDCWILLIPLAGTVIGASCVLFLKDGISRSVERALSGFAAGVMVAASIWSLLIPSMNQAEFILLCAFFPAVVCFWAVILFLFLLDHIIPHLHNHGT